MCAALVEQAVDEAVRDERRRILVTLVDGLDEVAERAVAAIWAEIPAYGKARTSASPPTCATRSCATTAPTCTRSSRTGCHHARTHLQRAAATRRARAGFALEDYLNAFRVGQQAFWEAVVDSAGAPCWPGRRAHAGRAADALHRLLQHARGAPLRRVPAVRRRRRRPPAPRPARAPARRRDADPARCWPPPRPMGIARESKMLVAAAVPVRRARRRTRRTRQRGARRAGLGAVKTLVSRARARSSPCS